MKKLLLILVPVAFMLNSFGPSSESNDFKFEVSLDGAPIGTHSVNKTVIGNSETFRVETETSAGLIGKMSHKFVMRSSFDDKKLVESDLKTWVNNDLESSTSLKWNGQRYVKQQGVKLSEIACGAAEYSSASLFFEEPIDRSALFHEKFGQELPVIHLGNHKYEVKLPNGGVERYTYNDGQVSEVQLVQTFTTITLRAAS